jgi:hypothetical protein
MIFAWFTLTRSKSCILLAESLASSRYRFLKTFLRFSAGLGTWMSGGSGGLDEASCTALAFSPLEETLGDTPGGGFGGGTFVGAAGCDTRGGGGAGLLPPAGRFRSCEFACRGLVLGGPAGRILYALTVSWNAKFCQIGQMWREGFQGS